jgi:hypothetical protein
MESLLESFPTPTFHPGTFPRAGQSSYTRARAERLRRERRRQQNRSTVPLSETTSSFGPVWPNLLKPLPNVPISFQIAYHQCKTSLKARNDYLINFKKSMLALGKNSRTLAPNLPTFPFQYQFEELRTWFRKEHLLRNKFNTLLRKWRERRYHNRKLNTEDPSTLCEPEVPIEVYDAKSRGKYIFEASALKRQVDSQLGNNKWMFPEPAVPRNPLTNMEFNLGQLLSLHKQLKANGETSWMLEGFAAANYSITDFFVVHKTALKLHALEDLVRNPADEDLCELVEEFVDDEYHQHRFKTRAKLTTIWWALNKKYSDPYIRQWHYLYRDYMKKLILHGNTYYAEHMEELDAIRKRSHKLLLSPQITVLAEERLASMPKKEVVPVPPPLPSVTVTLNAPVYQREVNINPIIGELVNGSITTISWTHLLAHIENLIDEVEVNGGDTPQADN